MTSNHGEKTKYYLLLLWKMWVEFLKQIEDYIYIYNLHFYKI